VDSRRVHVADVVLDDNYRQGMSVVGAVNVLVERSVFSNTGQRAGTPPMGGVDVEPDDWTQPFINVTFRDCVSWNNRGGGYLVGLSRSNASTPPFSILFDNCSSQADGANYQPAIKDRWIHEDDSINGGYTIGGVSAGTRGSITIRNAVVSDTPRPVSAAAFSIYVSLRSLIRSSIVLL
jgi:hypothetical protein